MAFQLTPIPPQLAEMGVKDLAIIMRNYDGEEHVLELEIAILTEKPFSKKQGSDIANLAGELTEEMCEAISLTIQQFTSGEETMCNVSCGIYSDNKDGE